MSKVAPKIKVCGLREASNVQAIVEAGADFIGFIFFERSPRKASNGEIPPANQTGSAQRVGVFVNAPLEKVRATIEQHDLAYVQLHGQETPDYCRQIRQAAKVIKAFPILLPIDFNSTALYADCCDYFLFDTASPHKSHYGGSGQRFNWEILRSYKGNLPFFLSGGIGPEDAARIGQLPEQVLAKMFAVDLNSRFEIKPGLKDTRQVQSFISEFKSTSHEVQR